MARYTTKQNDMLDAICHEYYKGQRGALEAVYNANPKLCEYGLLLPGGLVIVLPVLAPKGSSTKIDLFG
ncbi:tail protein X [Thalassotalea sp. G20_0]|uniref:tail protein X n=1 Tax=Thalassotalea sp. G20_0 TaxID=2821093 RepID=UPI001ADD3923|nr:tail protein X [Thalassotalea sp. G20_0]MBO9493840.1 tail protein X [Thalassotalea sp. G20_0]